MYKQDLALWLLQKDWLDCMGKRQCAKCEMAETALPKKVRWGKNLTTYALKKLIAACVPE
jgi:hypothetical protein